LILEAFSRVLKHPDNAQTGASTLLYEWLVAILMELPEPQSLASLSDNDIQPYQLRAVLTHNLDVVVQPGQIATPTGWTVISKHTNGQRLLNSLLEYARCYDDWQYRRFLHHSQPGDFGAWHQTQQRYGQ
jgi:hypothetical protein